MMNRLIIAALAGTLGLTAPAAGQQASSGPSGHRDDRAWKPLFNGRDLSGWYTFLQKHGKNRDPDGIVTIEEGAIHLYKNARDGDAVVMGYIATEEEHGNYHLRFQYRWGKKKFAPRYKMKRDAGCYYHLTGPDAVWPRALQFQVEETNVGDLIALHGVQLDTWIDPATRDDDPPTFLDPSRGGRPRVLGGKGIDYQKHGRENFEVEGWNTAKVIARGDTTIHRLNGHLVNRGRSIRLREADRPDTVRPLTRGRIALEIEAAEIEFRHVEILDLDETPAP
jgi:hypothetical protein